MPKSSDHYFGRITHEKSYSGTDFYRYDLYEKLEDGQVKTIGYIDFDIYEDCRGVSDMLPIIKASACPHAIHEQVVKHGTPDYIYSVGVARLQPSVPTGKGYGEILYLSAFKDLSSRLDANIIFISDECALGETSESAQFLWAKLARIQGAKHPYAWYQKKPQEKTYPLY